jgi:hypothetical protein
MILSVTFSCHTSSGREAAPQTHDKQILGAVYVTLFGGVKVSRACITRLYGARRTGLTWNRGVTVGQMGGIRGWLGGRDSNPDTQIQSLQSYR